MERSKGSPAYVSQKRVQHFSIRLRLPELPFPTSLVLLDISLPAQPLNRSRPAPLQFNLALSSP
jgi:hypothetical protein